VSEPAPATRPATGSGPPLPAPGHTVDSPAPGLWVHQPARGYRYAMDPLLLVGFVVEGTAPGAERRFVELGTGGGVAALLLARQGWVGEGIDVQQAPLDLAQRSADDSGLSAQLRFTCADGRAWADNSAGRAPVALCNPPYWPARSGPLPADPVVAASRFALHGDLDALIPALAAMGERVALVLPLGRVGEAARLLAAAGRPVARRLDLLPRLSLVEGRPAGGPSSPREEAPLRVDGDHSPRVRALYAAAGASLPLGAA